jgi:rubrerythrin
MERVEFESMIDLAIEREIEAFEFYSSIVEITDNKDLASIFAELATEEEGHKKLLESFKGNADLHFEIKAPDKDYHLAEKTELPKLSTDMKPAEAFALAMKKEQQAAEFYTDLANRSKDNEIREMCLNLANMELKHKQKVEKAYIDVAYVESF